MIRFEHVRKEYPGGTQAVQDFSLESPTGSITVLVGSSGCGKTTLLRMVNRMVDPSAGRVFIDDTDVASRDPVELRRSIGYVMQSGGLMPHKTVSENIQTVQKLRGVTPALRLARVDELMATVGLDRELLGRYPAQLSGGQQQRVGVARALAVDPNILLMDEPFGALDPLVRSDLQQELLAVQQKLAKTVLFVTHDIDEAFLLGDQVVILDTGAVVIQRGTPAEILAAPANDFVEAFIGADRGKRALHIETRGGQRIVVDSDQRVAGRLVEGP
ncbi:MAG: ATP-binding cassette domain-containing protein [Pontimonas sp.]|nr:MAG: ABC transporter ATP-binding subunit [actinobacterium acMicro-4]MCF8522898.1 ATP-binding cassette domain-containing protein [Pontimonas sp.]MCF8548209.1 ATP-binding cassette domain-containing protein [Pontimonas sp.]